MSMDKLRAEIIESMGRHQIEADTVQRQIDGLCAHLAAVKAKVSTLNDVLGSIDEMAETEPQPAAAAAAERPHGTGRAPRRDVMGAVKQAVRDYMEAKGLGPRLEDVQIGAGIILDSDLTESAVRRVLEGLVGRGEMRVHDGRYVPPASAILSAVAQ